MESRKSVSGLEIVCRISGNEIQGEPCVERIPGRNNLVALIPPPDYVGKNNEPVSKRIYSFSYVFDSDDTQRDVFHRCAADFVDDMLRGNNSLLFTYGVTGSGKTFTMAGNVNGDNSGLMPRTLDVLFRGLPNIMDKCVFKPNGRNGYTIQAPEVATRDRQNVISYKTDNTQRLVETKSVHCLNENYCSTVFVSFVEIYNDVVYDLLDPNGPNQRNGSGRNIRHDPNDGSTYVDDITEVEVQSTQEALEQYVLGQRRRMTATTLLNKSSSRSHSIFTIRLVAAPIDNFHFYPVMDDDKIVTSSMVLVDLAGSERAKRTEHQGERLNESNKINQSLLVLRNCFDRIRRNAKSSRNPQPVPYRDCKLTLLFKKFFEGYGRIRMIVCVNPQPTDFDENIFVMNFAERVNETTIEVVQQNQIPLQELNALNFPRRQVEQWNRQLLSSVPDLKPLQVNIFGSTPVAEIQHSDDSESVERMRAYSVKRGNTTKHMKDSLYQKHEALLAMIRNTACARDLYRAKYESLLRESDDLRSDYSKLLAENNHVTRENQALRLRLSAYESVEQTDRRRREKTQEELRKKSVALEKQRRQNRRVEQLLNEPIYCSENNGRIPLAEAVKQPVSEPARRKCEPSTNVAELRKQFDGTASAHVPRDRHYRGANHKHPYQNGTPISNVNTRYERRSKSAVASVRILDHQPTVKVPLGTIMQPQLPRNTTSTTRPSIDDLRRCNEYVITKQTTDENGALRTNLVKGNIIPTAGGGSAVMFNDIEVLHHDDPSK